MKIIGLSDLKLIGKVLEGRVGWDDVRVLVRAPSTRTRPPPLREASLAAWRSVRARQLADRAPPQVASHKAPHLSSNERISCEVDIPRHS